MVVLQTYYEIVDRPANEVNKCWKVSEIIILTIASLSGLFSYYIFSDLKFQFGDNCILYPHSLEFVSISPSLENNVFTRNYNDHSVTTTTPAPERREFDENEIETTTIKNITNYDNITIIDLSRTIWGNRGTCNYYQYVPIMSLIIGVIFITLFFMCPRGGTRETQSGIRDPWTIVPLTLVLTGVSAIFMVDSSIKTIDGINHFCAQFEPVLFTNICSPGIGQFALKERTSIVVAYQDITMLYIFLIICSIAWILAFAILLIRCFCCVVDFKIMQVTISSIDDPDETKSIKDELSSLSSRSGASVVETETEVLLTEPISEKKLPPMEHV